MSRAGLRFVSAPIEDRGVPDGSAFSGVLAGLVDDYRASMVAAAVLVLTGWDRDTVWAQLSEARGLPVPDVPEQRQWVEALVT